MNTVQIGNVQIALPPGVQVDTSADGVVSLHFSNLSGTMTLTPQPALPGEKRAPTASDSDGSQADKRARNSETPADEISEGASCAPAALSALRTDHHEAFFRNGGGMSPSQDSDDDNEQAPPRVLTWEEVSAAPPVSTQPEPAGTHHANSPPSPERDLGAASTQPPAPAAIATAAAAREILLAHGGLAKTSPGASSSASVRSGSGPLLAPTPSRSGGGSGSGVGSGRGGASGRGSSVAAGGASSGKKRALHAATSPGGADAAAGGVVTDARTEAVAAVGGGLSERLRAVDTFPFARTAKLDTWEWSALDATGARPPRRWGHSAAALGGCLYVMGGDDLTDSDDDILKDLYK